MAYVEKNTASNEASSGYVYTIIYNQGFYRSNFQTVSRGDIPKYSTINEVKIKADLHSSLSSTADYAVSIWDTDAKTLWNGPARNKKIPKNYATFEESLPLSYFQNNNAFSGEMTSACYFTGFNMAADVIRKFYGKNSRICITYTPPTYRVNVSSNNTNFGTVSGGGTWDVSKTNQTKTITATAKTGYRFVKWNDGNTSASRSVTFSENTISSHSTTVTYTATFEPLKYYIDLNGVIDGVSSGGINPAGTADVYINGSLVGNDITDIYSQYDYGSTYEIRDIKPMAGYEYIGVSSGAISGTLTSAKTVVLAFRTIPLPDILSVEIAPNPANTGQGLTIKVKTN